MRDYKRAAALGLTVGIGLVGRAAAQVSLNTVALSGQPAPGMPAEVGYEFVDMPTVNEVGQVTYRAVLSGPAITPDNRYVVYAGAPDFPQLVLRSGTAVPNAGAGVTFLDFVMRGYNSAGRVLVIGYAQGTGVTGFNDSGIYIAQPGAAVQPVAREDDPIVAGSGNTYSDFSVSVHINDANQPAYFATLKGTGVTASNDTALFAGTVPQQIAREGSITGLPGNSRHLNFGNELSVNDAGIVAYATGLTSGDVTPANDTAVLIRGAGAPTLVAREGDAAPGVLAGLTYGSLSNAAPALNDAGQVAFKATLSGAGVTADNDVALYGGAPAALQLAAREGDVAPGTGGATYSSVESGTGVGINDAGHLVFGAGLTGAGVTPANASALFVGSPADPQVIVRAGDAAPGTAAGVTYVNAFAPTLNNAGQVAFRGAVKGPGVTASNDQALFLFDPVLGDVLIAREGDAFDIGGGVTRTIGSIAFHAGRTDDALTSLSHDGTVAFHLSFTDGSTGVFTAALPKLYWDTNGTAAGAGGASPGGTWDGSAANFNSDAGGGAGGSLGATTTADDTVVFSAGVDGTGSYAVTVSGTQAAAAVGVSRGDVTFGGAGTIATHRFTVAGGAAASVGAAVGTTTGFTKAGAGTLTLTSANTYTGGTTVESGTLVVAHPDAINASQALSIGVEATARSQAGMLTAMDVSSLAVAHAGRVDLNDGGLVQRNGGSGTAAQDAARQITALLKTGLENGGNFDWQGPGISSTEAFHDNTTAGSVLYGLGVIQNNLAAAGTPDATTTDATAGKEIYTSFKGRTVALNDTLIRYTYMGDADLSGDITSTDYSLIDSGFALALSGWLNGDFDYSGVVDATDYALIDNAFAFQAGTPLPDLAAYDEHVAMFGQSYLDAVAAVQSGVVPEPGTLSLLAVAGAFAARRRRRAK